MSSCNYNLQDQFTKFFHYQIPEEILYTHIIKILHLTFKYVFTLPCETWKMELLLISMAYCMWDLRIYLARYEAALIALVWILMII